MSTTTLTETGQALPAGTWNVDPVHSTVGFAVKYMVSTFRTEFDRYEATLDTTGDEPRLYGSVAPDSIVIKDPNFHAHLQSPDFFDTERHPAITFESTSIRRDGDELIVDGELTIKGNTHPVEGRGVLVGPHDDIAGNTKVGLTLDQRPRGWARFSPFQLRAAARRQAEAALERLAELLGDER